MAPVIRFRIQAVVEAPLDVPAPVAVIESSSGVPWYHAAFNGRDALAERVRGPEA
jgi:hypothetical protein